MSQVRKLIYIGCGLDKDSPGCGKCILVSNTNSDQPTWKAIIMKKNRCPPWLIIN
jgi:hypothetical protein